MKTLNAVYNAYEFLWNIFSFVCREVIGCLLVFSILLYICVPLRKLQFKKTQNETIALVGKQHKCGLQLYK